ncbi:MAG: ethanolamine utilization microcompartment protein EutL [Clostridia bacterium]|nr:ethanolamine utilization microcompartment protein EutL [Clostridia bacterium]
MKGERIQTNVLSVQVIPNADANLLKNLGAPEGHRSLGIFTADCDDVSYSALDEATKKANVSVVYARSMYAGSGNASTALAGEFIGILSAPDPAEIKSGLDAAVDYATNDAAFYTANDDGSVVYFANLISRTGSYLSAQAGVPEGTSMAYLIAPPAEAIVALDAAVKASGAELKLFYGPPTETNFAGGLLVGDQAACREACEAFAAAVEKVAMQPFDY